MRIIKNFFKFSLFSLYIILFGIFSITSVYAGKGIDESCTAHTECTSGLCANFLCKLKMGSACTSNNQCGSDDCEDSFCDCEGSPSDPSIQCAREYGLTSDLNAEAPKWKCEDEGKDPDKNRGFLDFCVNRSFTGAYPENSTADVKYPVERKAYMGEPCYYSSVCLSQPSGDDVCNETAINSTKENDPWFGMRSKLSVCECSTAIDAAGVLAQFTNKICSQQYGAGTYTCVDGSFPGADGTNVCKKSNGWEPQSLADMQKWSGPPLGTPEDATNKTSIFGFDATIPTINPVQPAPKITIPGVIFSKISKESSITTDETGASWLNVPFLGEYISAIYKYSVGLISLIAVMVLIISGVQIVTSAGSSETISAAKHRIISSVIAIALTAGSYTILYTINPELVNLRNLKILVVQGKNFAEELKASGNVATELLSQVNVSTNGVIPQLVDGVYSKGLTVPPASSCSSPCEGTICATQQIRDMAYEAQLKTGYPAAVMIAQYLIEGPSFGVKCKNGFEPALNRSSWGAKDDPSLATISATKIKDVLKCESQAYCSAGYTWECSNKEKYKNEKKPVAVRDYQDGNPTGTNYVDCGKGPKKGQGYIRISGYACFGASANTGNVFAPLINFYEKYDCYKNAKATAGGSPEIFALKVQQCGYATGQGYGAAIISKMKTFCLLGNQGTVSLPAESADENPQDVTPIQ